MYSYTERSTQMIARKTTWVSIINFFWNYSCTNWIKNRGESIKWLELQLDTLGQNSEFIDCSRKIHKLCYVNEYFHLIQNLVSLISEDQQMVWWCYVWIFTTVYESHKYFFTHLNNKEPNNIWNIKSWAM